MKNKISSLIFAAIAVAIIIYAFTPKDAPANPVKRHIRATVIDDPYPYPVQQWQKVGNAAMSRMDYMKLRQVFIKLTPTVANGGTIDISALGLTTIMTKQISAQRNNNNAYDVPQASFKTVSNTAVTYNIVQGSNTLVSVLGLSVLGGPSTIFATDLANIELNIMITGY